MLVENLKAGEVVVLKPKQGSEIIGRLAKDFASNNTEVVVNKPLEAHVVRDDKSLGLAFAPFSLSAKDEQVFSFPVDGLAVAPFLARDEVKKSYSSQTSSLLFPK